MTNTATVEKYQDNSLYITAVSGEDFLATIVQKAKEGYEIVTNTVSLNMYIKRCVMYNPSQNPVQEHLQESAQVDSQVTDTEPDKVVDDPDIDIDLVQNQVDNLVSVPLKDLVEVYSQAVVGSFKGDKNKLEQYGKKFSIELKKSKSFDNMVKDLEDHVAILV